MSAQVKGDGQETGGPVVVVVVVDVVVDVDVVDVVEVEVLVDEVVEVGGGRHHPGGDRVHGHRAELLRSCAR